MQTIYDLTDDEIATLTDEQVNLFVDIECAKAGAPLLPPEPQELSKPEAKEDKTFYGVAGVYFEKPEEAAELLAVIDRHRTFEYDYKSFGKVAKPGRTYGANEITSVKMFSVGYYDEHRKSLEQYEAEKRKFDSEKKRHEQAVNERRETTAAVWELVSIARELKAEREQIARSFQRYLELAKGDKEIAFNFLKAGMAAAGYEHEHDAFLESFSPLAAA